RAVDQHGGGATLPVVAPFLGSGQPEVIAKGVKERGPGLDGEPPDGPAHLEDDVCLARHAEGHAASVEPSPEARRARALPDGSDVSSPRVAEPLTGSPLQVG